VPAGNHLGNRRHLAAAQAAAAYHEIAEAIQQAIAHVVLGDGSHGGSPAIDACFWHYGGVLASKGKVLCQKLLTSRRFVCDAGRYGQLRRPLSLLRPRRLVLVGLVIYAPLFVAEAFRYALIVVFLCAGIVSIRLTSKSKDTTPGHDHPFFRLIC
jgi:hypothetical protein